MVGELSSPHKLPSSSTRAEKLLEVSITFSLEGSMLIIGVVTVATWIGGSILGLHPEIASSPFVVALERGEGLKASRGVEIKAASQ